jgi:hypothetical protein
VDTAEPQPTGATAPKPDQSTVATGNKVVDTSSEGAKGGKRGPKPDFDMVSRVAEIVACVAPGRDWRAKLDDVCEALDEADIPFPSRWRKQDKSCRGWTDYNERANAVKAIEYRLEIAKQRKKATSETLS